MYNTSKESKELVEQLSQYVLQEQNDEQVDVDQLLIQFDEKQEHRSGKPKWFKN